MATLGQLPELLQVARCAAALRANGLSRGDRVAIVLPKCIEECWAILGTSQASGVFVPVNSVLRAQQIRHIVEDSGAQIVICSRALFETTSAALAGLDRLTILCAEPTRQHGHCSVSAKYDRQSAKTSPPSLHVRSLGSKGVMLTVAICWRARGSSSNISDHDHDQNRRSCRSALITASIIA
jgi:acyl-CoA synthetase (AMP-forming)/AMP-acid ligase II